MSTVSIDPKTGLLFINGFHRLHSLSRRETGKPYWKHDMKAHMWARHSSRTARFYCAMKTAIYRAGCQQGKENPEQDGINGGKKTVRISARRLFHAGRGQGRDLCGDPAGSLTPSTTPRATRPTAPAQSGREPEETSVRKSSGTACSSRPGESHA